MIEPETCLQLENVSHSYNEHPVLSSMNLTLSRGSFCALLGANGVGKSTLLRILSGSLTPLKGTVMCWGELGFVPQDVHPALPLTALEMVLLGRSGKVGLLQAPSKADYGAAHAALCRVEVEHLAQRSFSSLSGGERQLVLMARALATEADILILDEPSAAMDWHNQALVLRLLADLAEKGMTIVMSTHSPQHALEFASHALLLFGRGQYDFGLPSQIMTEMALSRLYRLPVRRVEIDELPLHGTAVPIFSMVCND